MNRQLVSVRLEKNEAAKAGEWISSSRFPRREIAARLCRRGRGGGIPAVAGANRLGGSADHLFPEENRGIATSVPPARRRVEDRLTVEALGRACRRTSSTSTR